MQRCVGGRAERVGSIPATGPEARGARHREIPDTPRPEGRDRGPLALAALLEPLPRGPARDGRARASSRFLALVAIFAPLIVDVLGLPDPNEKDPGARDSFGTATGPEQRAPARRRPDAGATSSRGSSTAPASRSSSPSSRRFLASVAGIVSGPRRRLLPRLGRLDRLARRRRPARDPLPAPRDRPRRLLLARRRLPRRRDPARPRRRHLRDRVHELDVHRPRRPRPGPLAAREGVRARLALARRLAPADHLPRDPAQPGRADRRLRDRADAAGDPLRVGAVVPRRRRRPATRRAGAR